MGRGFSAKFSGPHRATLRPNYFIFMGIFQKHEVKSVN